MSAIDRDALINVAQLDAVPAYSLPITAWLTVKI